MKDLSSSQVATRTAASHRVTSCLTGPCRSLGALERKVMADKIPCAKCSYQADDAEDLVAHAVSEHGTSSSTVGTGEAKPKMQGRKPTPPMPSPARKRPGNGS